VFGAVRSHPLTGPGALETAGHAKYFTQINIAVYFGKLKQAIPSGKKVNK